MKSVIASKPWLHEPSLVPIPWKDQESYLKKPAGRNLKIGVMFHDGVVMPHPPIFHALKDVVNRLRKVDDIDIVEWQPYKHDEAWEILSHLYFSDGAREESTALDESGEPWRPLSNFIIKDNPNVKELTVKELWHWTARREAYKSAYAQKWNETATGTNASGEPEGAVDVILCPAGPGAAPPLDHARYWGYTSQWNILDYPALVFPVTRADPSPQDAFEGREFMSPKDAENFKIWSSGPEKYKGAPISLQLVGRRYEDEKVPFPFSLCNPEFS